MEEGVIKMMQVLYKNSTNKVRAHNNESTEFITKKCLKQGRVLSPLLLSIVLDDALIRCFGEKYVYLLLGVNKSKKDRT